MNKALEEEIRGLIGDGKLDIALNKFVQWANATGSDLKNSLIIQKGRLAKVTNESSLGLIDPEDANLTRNQITHSVLTLLEQAAETEEEEEVQKPPVVPLPPQPREKTIVQPASEVVSEKASDSNMSNIILFLASNPWDTARLQLEKEFTKVFNSLQNSKFVVKSEFAVTPSSLQKAILKYKPRIVHFSGHGLTSNDISTIQNTDDRGIAMAARNGAGIVLQDEKGRAKIMETKNLVAMFQTFTKYKINIDTVIFNSCHSKAQADGIRNYVNYVVGYSNAIKDDAAILIAHEFYGYYAEHDNVELAYDLTKNIVNVEGYSEDQLMELLKKG